MTTLVIVCVAMGGVFVLGVVWLLHYSGKLKDKDWFP